MVLLLPGMFEFAAPPMTGGHWFVQACREAGLLLFPDNSAFSASFYPWPEGIERDRDKDALRVSLVCHPCDWLRSVFDAFRLGPNSESKNVGSKYLWPRFVELPKKQGFGKFVVRYLEAMPGEATRIFNSYKADTRLRLEDMPWALVELLESMGIDRKSLDRVLALEGRQDAPKRSKWRPGRPDLRQQVMEAEAEFCRDLDYY